jgi:hypothetical protein
MAYALRKWDIIRVFRPDLTQPHDKFCICICPNREWFLYINSQPPKFRKRRQAAVTVASWEVMCLVKTSYIDTASMIDDLPKDHLALALSDHNRQHGPLAPSIRDKIRMAVNAHGVFTQEQTVAVVID